MNLTSVKTPDLPGDWIYHLESEFRKPYWGVLKEFLLQEKMQGNIVYPPASNIFEAFKLTPFQSIKVVILGQDPYHGPGQAHGLCFSVPDKIPTPPSLVNIFKEIESDTGSKSTSTGNLTDWAKQGVFLLNSVLTVRAGLAGSHRNRGWEIFTDEVIRLISTYREGIVFLLWGSYAIAKSELIPPNKHLILTAPHPSPLSAYRGFMGCKHFSQTNAFLQQQGKSEIHW